MHKSILANLGSGKERRKMIYHYEKMYLNIQDISSNVMYYTSHLNLDEAYVPSKLFLMFQESARFQGRSKRLNFYEFKRFFEPADEVTQNIQRQRRRRPNPIPHLQVPPPTFFDDSQLLSRRNVRRTSILQKIISYVIGGPQEETESESGTLRRSQSLSSMDLEQDQEDEEEEEPFLDLLTNLKNPALNKSVIQKIEVKVAGVVLDSLVGEEDEWNYVLQYTRFHLTNGTFGTSPYTNDITYEDFGLSYYICSFDLSESMDAADPFVVPKLKNGPVTVSVKFSKILKENVTMIYACTYPSVMYMDHVNNKWSLSSSL
jgi:hypothetical protein